MPDIAYVALGTNLGNRAAYLHAARAAISLIPQLVLLAASSVEETAPLGITAQGPYLNQMIAVSTSLLPNDLLLCLQRIERGLGRVRVMRWGARTIDLDIVRFGSRTLATKGLTLPHPGLPDRDFWRREVAELDACVGSPA